jgi:hypothetical protein
MENKLSLQDIVDGLKGFGLEDFEETLNIKVGARTINLRISNIPTEDEMAALLAVEEYKGYAWIQRVKCEILSRSITYIDGITLKQLTPVQRLIVDPTSHDGVQRDIQIVLRNLLLGWGQELVGVLWKVLMTHASRIEDALIQQFPDSAVMTELEKRFFENAYQQIDEQNEKLVKESLEEMYDTPLPEVQE